ncbi:MAG: type II toxin-antitoxin system RelE/ParE family toxin [Spirochaetia bacterium]|nr:type II toxin-antitoxin system RelE/ParE family toxin [Spirochaetia bacterium]
MKIIWTKKGRATLREIRKYISEDSPIRANEFINELIDKVSLLASNPNIGTELPEVNRPDIRGIVHGNYKILYLVADKVYVFRIIHVRRNFNYSKIKTDFPL